MVVFFNETKGKIRQCSTALFHAHSIFSNIVVHTSIVVLLLPSLLGRIVGFENAGNAFDRALTRVGNDQSSTTSSSSAATARVFIIIIIKSSISIGVNVNSTMFGIASINGIVH